MSARCPIAAVGASAGGLDPLRRFVGALPRDMCFAVIVQQHLPPFQPSHLSDLLAKVGNRPVETAASGVTPTCGHVYVVPPGMVAEVIAGRIVLTADERRPSPHRPIDTLYTSLAEDLGPLSAGVVLSGDGADGAAGLVEIKTGGGITFAEPTAEAQFPAMPENAIAAGGVRHILSAAEIPRLLQAAFRAAPAPGLSNDEPALSEGAAHLPEIVDILRTMTGRDFSRYKTGTLSRRLQRRLVEQRAFGVDRYVQRLRNDPTEAQALARDFLIVVTSLFRDPDAFEEVRNTTIPRLLSSGKGSYRIWSVGCATGEEAHTLAILWQDALKRADPTCDFQCFATDVQSRLIDRARRARYGADEIANVPADLVEGSFEITAQGYRVRPEIRERCVFAVHDLLVDPPFSEIDMVSCRNLLIYLRPEAQREALTRIHFSLAPRGVLMLGSAESTAQAEGMFEPISEEYRLFRKVERDRQHAVHLSSNIVTKGPTQPGDLLTVSGPRHAEDISSLAEHAYVAAFAHPFLLVSQDNSVLYVSEGMAPLLRHEGGTITASVERLLQRELRGPILSSLHEARQSEQEVVRPGVRASVDGQTHRFDLVVKPASKGASIVALLPRSAPNAPQQQEDRQSGDDPESATLRRDLAEARDVIAEAEIRHAETMQGLIEANETLMSMNVELKSSHEELETSREELESVNEELKTVNAELKESNFELLAARNNMNNMLLRTEVALLFLDGELNLRLSTEAARDLYAIRDSDCGRPLSELRAHVDYPGIEEDARRVMRTLTAHAQEVRTYDGTRCFIARISPYRTLDDRIDGTVIAFVDVTEQKQAEIELRAQAATIERQLAELEAFYAEAPIGISLLDSDLRYLRINNAMAAMNGATPAAHIGHTLQEMVPGIGIDATRQIDGVLRTGKPVRGKELVGTTPGDPDRERTWLVDYFPVSTSDGAFAIGTCVTDVTEQRDLQRKLEAKQEELDAAEARLFRLFDESPAIIVVFEGADHGCLYANGRAKSELGFDPVGMTVAQIFPNLAKRGETAVFDRAFRSGNAVITPELVPMASREAGQATERIFSRVLQPWTRADGSVAGVMVMAQDVTDIAAARNLEKDARREIEQIQNSVPAFIATLDRAGNLRHANEYAWNLTTARPSEELGRPFCAGRWWTKEAADLLRQSLAEATEGVEKGFEASITAPDGRAVQVDVRIAPHFNRGHEITGYFVTALDVTDRHRAEAQQMLLFHELQHRLKNTLALVMAMTDFTSDSAETKEDMTRALQGRLNAIRRSMERLTDSDWEGLTLQEIVSSEVEALMPEAHFSLDLRTIDFTLEPSRALALALAMHELATNALKHGALTSPNGRVAISAGTEDSGGTCVLHWVETGGPAPAASDRTGFGTFLLKTLLAADLGGQVTLDMPETGLTCTIRFPVDPPGEN
ncbi:Chemotaxis protein methyltransferase CheR [Rhodovulum sp. P5]|nr:Chemotaxis protein methyltransferase CheR [Rhodovulum sp. P5]